MLKKAGQVVLPILRTLIFVLKPLKVDPTDWQDMSLIRAGTENSFPMTRSIYHLYSLKQTMKNICRICQKSLKLKGYKFQDTGEAPAELGQSGQEQSGDGHQARRGFCCAQGTVSPSCHPGGPVACDSHPQGNEKNAFN